ncbi:MAG: DUF4326 domain-containing protein [bacterium]|nr:DUF4326 domain-containing protein [bacterium]
MYPRPGARILRSAMILMAGLLCGCAAGSGDPDIRTTPSATLIVNLAADEYDIYIGRGSDPRTHMLTAGVRPGERGWLGNPHPIGYCDLCDLEHTRDECIAAFREDFRGKLTTDDAFRAAVLALRGKRLGCYCKPKNCHGDVIKAYLDSG